MKQARKVALISVFDYPRERYSAYWVLQVNGTDEEGYRWGAHLFSYEPVAWDYEGKRTAERPNVPWPVYPADIGPNDYPHGSEMEAAQEARRQECARVYETAPKPVYLIEEAVGVCDTRNDADTEAQEWVLERIESFRKTGVPPMSDDEVHILTAQFDKARRDRSFGEVDRIRGKLKAAGIVIAEQESIGYEGRTEWSRKAAGGKKSGGKQSGHTLTMGPIDLLWQGVAGLLDRLFRGLTYALAYATTLRNNRQNAIRDYIDAGAGAGLWRIYDGSRPATCGTATTLLAELTCTDPCAAAASSGAMTFSAITADASANATGTATWARIVDSTGTCCVDMSVGTSGSDLNLNSTSISTGQQVSITSAVITEGNA